jgi:hypothetical protein
MVIAIGFTEMDYWGDRLEIMTHGNSDRHNHTNANFSYFPKIEVVSLM